MDGTLIDFITIAALFLGPITAVVITLWHQGRSQRRDMQSRAYLVLLAHRKATPPTQAQVEALNTLDALFHKEKGVLNAWHKYYEDLCRTINTPAEEESRRQKYIELLTAIGLLLGYSDVRQVDMEKFYYPFGRAQIDARQNEILNELLRVLKNTKSLSASPGP